MTAKNEDRAEAEDAAAAYCQRAGLQNGSIEYSEALWAFKAGARSTQSNASKIACLGNLDDEVRIPIDEVWSDIDYLIARVEQGSLSRDEVVQLVRKKIDTVKAVLTSTTQSPLIEDRAAGDVEGQREVFEAAYCKQFHRTTAPERFPDGSLVTYKHPTAETSWIFWQAALASATPSAAVGEGTEHWRPDERIVDLALRLVKTGPKAAHVSASECHEITDFILELANADTIPTKPGHMVVPIALVDAVRDIVDHDAGVQWSGEDRFHCVGKVDFADLVNAFAMLNATQGGKGEVE